MHRKKIIQLLSSYQISPGEDEEKLALFKSFVEKHETCFERTLFIGHITGSSWIVNKQRTHTLLTLHKKLDCWLQLGGHADGDSDIFSVALREAKEESGLKEIYPLSKEIFDIDIHRIPSHKDVPEHLHYDVRFIFEANCLEKITLSDESKDLSWIKITQLHKYNRENSILRMAQKQALYYPNVHSEDKVALQI